MKRSLFFKTVNKPIKPVKDWQKPATFRKPAKDWQKKNNFPKSVQNSASVAGFKAYCRRM